MRINSKILVILGLVILVPACGGGGSGGPAAQSPPPPPPPPPGPPPPPPQAACDGYFPGMAYEKPDTGPETPGFYLASSDGCRSEFVYDSADLRGRIQFYVATDLSAGVLVWTEDPGSNNQSIVLQQTFTVAPDGTLTLDTPEQILPRPGDEPAAGDFSSYFVNLWGGPTTGSLYLAVSHFEELISANGEQIDSFLIYDLNDMSQVREIFREVDGVGNWVCPAVPNPQYVPSCYNLFTAAFNASGTRLYWSDNRQDGQGDRWDALLRIDVDMTGGLASWTIGDPEIVFTAQGDGPAGGPPRPGSDRTILPDPEIIGSSANTGSPTSVVNSRIFLNADQCAGLYAALADGTSAGSNDLWMQCEDNQFVAGDPTEGNGSGGGDWQSPDTVLSVRPPESPAIYRFHVSGAMAGTEELLIDNGEAPDTGL